MFFGKQTYFEKSKIELKSNLKFIYGTFKICYALDFFFFKFRNLLFDDSFFSNRLFFNVFRILKEPEDVDEDKKIQTINMGFLIAQNSKYTIGLDKKKDSKDPNDYLYVFKEPIIVFDEDDNVNMFTDVLFFFFSRP